MRTKLPLWLWAAIALTALVSLYSVNKRFQVESSNKAVSMAAEYEVVESLAAAQGIPVSKALADLKAQGLRSVVLSEDSLGQLVSEGKATIAHTATPLDGNGRPMPEMAGAVMQFSDPSEIQRVVRGLKIRFGARASGIQPMGNAVALPPYSTLTVRATPIGLNPVSAELVQRAGLSIIARCSNPAGVSATGVKETLKWASDMGATAFLPMGDQVLGRRDALETTVETLKNLGMLYATPEFSKIGGDANVVEEAPEIVVRLHSAQVAELDKMPLPDIVERYAKAARERGMRYLLIRPVSFGAEQPLADFADLVRRIGTQIRNEGGDLGVAKPYREPNLPRPVLPIIGLGVAAVAYFVGAAFVTDRKLRIAGAVLVTLLGLACWNHTGAKLDALLAAIVFPVAAFLILDSWRPKNPLLGFFAVTVVSLVGGLAVAGLLNGLKYYVVADEFMGVKVAVFVPLLIVGYLFFRELTDWRANLRSPITWGMSALTVVVAGLIALMIARTGNDTGVGASGTELHFRNLLDAVLYVRPRTKEFMVGHPILVVAIAMLARYGRQKGGLAGWTVIGLMLGAMGQTSVVNTLCHFHVPIALSLARIGIGAVLGSIIGLALWFVIARFLPRPQTESTIAD